MTEIASGRLLHHDPGCLGVSLVVLLHLPIHADLGIHGIPLDLQLGDLFLKLLTLFQPSLCPETIAGDGVFQALRSVLRRRKLIAAFLRLTLRLLQLLAGFLQAALDLHLTIRNVLNALTVGRDGGL